MNRVSVRLLALIIISNPLAIAQKSTAQQASNTCAQAMAIIKNDIENRIGGKVESVNQRQATNPSSPLPGRKDESDIYLSNIPGVGRPRNPATPSQSAKNHAITNSADLMRRYATQLIQGCPSIGRVTFTHGFHPEGIFIIEESGRVVPAKCKNPDHGETIRLNWNEYLCL